MPSDVRTLLNGFAKNPLLTRREGLYFKEKDYKCVRADDCSLYAKNVSIQGVENLPSMCRALALISCTEIKEKESVLGQICWLL